MKKYLAALLTLALLFIQAPVPAEPADALPTQLDVGSTTQMSGNFFTDLWGNNTADLDVRALIHGYSTVAWTRDGFYAVDNTVVRDVVTTLNERGDKTYTFQINQNLTYNDGTPITAKDYVFTALLVSSPLLKSLGAQTTSMSHLWGYADYDSGLQNYFAGVRLLADDMFSLTIPAEALPDFYELMLVNVNPFPLSVIAPGCDVLDDGQGAYIQSVTEGVEFNAELLNETLLAPETGYVTHPKVTCGPYTLVNYDEQTHEAEFAVNEQYLGNFEGQKPSIETLTFKQCQNETMLEAYQNGEFGLLNKVSDGAVINAGLELAGAEQAQALNYLRAGFGFLSFACEQGATQSLNVRKALAMCVDAQTYCQDYMAGYALPAYGYYGYGQWMASQNQEALNALNVYALNLNAAENLLIEDGWVFNADGGDYAPGEGAVRYRLNDATGLYEPLTVRWAKTVNTASERLRDMIEPNMKAIGVDLQVTEMPFSEMLTHYYRQTERGYEMFFLATNFANVYDPFDAVSADPAYQGVFNTTGIDDSELARLASDLRKTESADLEGYVAKFLKFQERFSAVLPMAPIYSNIYFDFYLPGLYGYQTNAYWSWGAAIVYATFTPPEPEPTPEAGDAAAEDGELVTIE